MSVLLALDPGKTTGASIWHYSDDAPLTNVAHMQVEGGLNGFLQFMMPYERVMPFSRVVSESFRLDGRTPNPDVTPLRIEGALEVMSILMRAPVCFQPNSFKKYIDNDKLKEFNLYWPGEQHAMDSARHALAWALTNKHMPSLLHYFGPVE